MPNDVGKVVQYKERILSFIESKGPSLPIQIAHAINVSTLFASAFLSELYSDQKIKASNMRVGSSALYYLSGQEAQLENFVQYLNQREREAFSLLKKEKTLQDLQQTPVIRVALRAIKDFAVPIKVRDGQESILFWKYFTISNEEFVKLIREVVSPPKIEEKPFVTANEPTVLVQQVAVKEVVTEKKIEEEPLIKKSTKESQSQQAVKDSLSLQMGTNENNHSKLSGIKPIWSNKKSPVIMQENEFSQNIKRYLNSKGIEISEIIDSKKKEFVAKVRADNLFGKQEYYFVAKDKKNISDNDFAMAFHKAQSEKMPCLFISYGNVNSKGKEYISLWGNLIKFEKINIV
ncbi:MAG: FaeA/PapI family transcriptional regulator [Nanoarchaeota archaeon]|nr:FaeA/PapI family transcriptional regulator [Nanoarchaeota archaeon]